MKIWLSKHPEIRAELNWLAAKVLGMMTDQTWSPFQLSKRKIRTTPPISYAMRDYWQEIFMLKHLYMPESKLAYELPVWLFFNYWTLAAYAEDRSTWKYVPRAYNVVPIDSPIFAAVANGDVKQLRSLLWSGRASINDVANDGHTLLHVSEMTTHSCVAGFLIRMFRLQHTLGNLMPVDFF